MAQVMEKNVYPTLSVGLTRSNFIPSMDNK